MKRESTLPVPGDILAEKYRVERLLGAGGMGSVFEVMHRVTGKRFAVKWLLPELSANEEAVQRFIREAQVAGHFDHPNAVEVYDIGQERGSLYMVMELLRGESLSALLERERRISPERAARILLPCLRAVARAHRAGIVHRDLKPPNIFLCSAREGGTEQPKVLDFGISKIMRRGEVSAQLTKGGMVMGTPHYMAPEQVRGQAIDARADVYAFGVILYELVSGRLPFPSENFAELVLQIATSTPKPLDELVPGLCPEFAQLVQRAMARSADERFASATEMAQALEVFATRSESHAAAEPARASHTPRGLAHDRGKTLELNTPLVSNTSSAPLPPSLLAPGRLSWMLVTLATAVTALVVTLLLLWPRRDADIPQGPTTNAAAIVGTETAQELRPPAPVPAPVPPAAPPAVVVSPATPQPTNNAPAAAPQARGLDVDTPDDGERVIGPWKRQPLPGRSRRTRVQADDAFDPYTNYGEEEAPRRGRDRRRPSPPLRADMAEDEF